MTRSELREQLKTLALCIGLRPAARKLGVNEDTACAWARRGNWQLSLAFQSSNGRAILNQHYKGRNGDVPRAAQASASVASESLRESLQEHSDDSRLYLSAAVLKASHAAASQDGEALLRQGTSIALLNTARTGDITHGWTADRAKPAQVNVAVVMPTPEQDAERQAAHDALDAITAKLLAE